MSFDFDPDDMHSWLGQYLRCEASRVVAGSDEDDCGVVGFGDRVLIISTDFLNADPISVRLGFADPEDLGRLVVDVSIADIVSSGANPIGILVGVMLPRSASEEEFRGLIEGAKAEADEVGAHIVGGDSKIGKERCLYSVGIGEAGRGAVTLLSGATPGDDVWVSGCLGNVAAAVVGLSEGTMPDTWRSWARKSLVKPSVPVGSMLRLAESRALGAGTDVSDGLGVDLTRICKKSNVGVEIESWNIPVEPEVKRVAAMLSIPDWVLPFTIGGDCQMVVTANTGAKPKLVAEGFHWIGRITAEHQRRIIHEDGRWSDLPTRGHRDSKTESFAEEVRDLASGLA